MNIQYRVNSDITTDELIKVFNSVGWNKDKEVIVKAFKNSYYVLAYSEDELVGFGRAISDHFFYTGIYDIVVDPRYQGKGIAKKIMGTLIEEFKDTYFFLTYTDGNREFYEKCGFKQNDQSMWIPR